MRNAATLLNLVELSVAKQSTASSDVDPCQSVVRFIGGFFHQGVIDKVPGSHPADPGAFRLVDQHRLPPRG